MLTWIIGLALASQIAALLIAPMCDVVIGRKTVRPLLVAAFMLSVAFVFSNAAHLVTQEELPFESMVLGIISGIVGALGLFFTVFACARFSVNDAPVSLPSETE